MSNGKYLHVYLFAVLICAITAIIIERKTSYGCSACNTPHVLTCTDGGVIVLQYASYIYKTRCNPDTIGAGGCSELERIRCCNRGGLLSRECTKSFNIIDAEELETVCSGKSTCIFNRSRHDQNYTCNSIKFTKHSLSYISYNCQRQDTDSVPFNLMSSSTKEPIDTTTHKDGLKEEASSDGKITSGEIAGIVLGVIAIVIVLCMAAFLLYKGYENTALAKYHQSERYRQQPRTRTVGAQYSETDFAYINATPDIPVTSSDTDVNYSKLDTLATDPVQYDHIIMNKTQKANTKYNASGNYNQQYVNM